MIQTLHTKIQHSQIATVNHQVEAISQSNTLLTL